MHWQFRLCKCSRALESCVMVSLLWFYAKAEVKTWSQDCWVVSSFFFLLLLFVCFYCCHLFTNSLPFHSQFYIQSTDYDRTIMSAQSYLSGLFPPTSSQIWNPELLWQPIPVHVVTKSTDRVSIVWMLPIMP